MYKFLCSALFLLLFTAGCTHTDHLSEIPLSAETAGSSTATELLSSPDSTGNSDTAEKSLHMETGGRIFSLQLYDNAAAETFLELLPLTLTMNELNRNEKFFYLSSDLPTAPSNPASIHTGDLMLYGSNCLVLFYQNFSTSYSYTPLGRINEPSLLAQALGCREAVVHFYLAQE